MKWTYFLVILFLGSLIPVESQVQASIINYGYQPKYPLPGSSIEVYATLNLVPNNFDNLTLVYSVNGEASIRTAMSSIGGSKFTGVIPGQESGTKIEYWIELYVGGSVTDRKPEMGSDTISISLFERKRIPVNVSYGSPVELPSGNFSLKGEDGKLTLNVTVSSPVSINITTSPLESLTIDSPYSPLSDLYSISLNASDVVEEGVIEIQYSTIHVQEIGAIEEKLKLLRDEGSGYSEYPAFVDIEKKTLIANTTSFSDWLVGTDNELLRLLDLNYPENILINNIFSMSFKLSNLGNSVAFNVSVILFLPVGITLVNNESRFYIQSLYPLENISFSLNLFVEQEGNYSLVIVVEGGDRLYVNTPLSLNALLNSTDTPSTTSRTTFFLSTLLIVLVLLTKMNKTRKRYRP